MFHQLSCLDFPWGRRSRVLAGRMTEVAIVLDGLATDRIQLRQQLTEDTHPGTRRGRRHTRHMENIREGTCVSGHRKGQVVGGNRAIRDLSLLLLAGSAVARRVYFLSVGSIAKCKDSHGFHYHHERLLRTGWRVHYTPFGSFAEPNTRPIWVSARPPRGNTLCPALTKSQKIAQSYLSPRKLRSVTTCSDDAWGMQLEAYCWRTSGGCAPT